MCSPVSPDRELLDDFGMRTSVSSDLSDFVMRAPASPDLSDFGMREPTSPSSEVLSDFGLRKPVSPDSETPSNFGCAGASLLTRDLQPILVFKSLSYQRLKEILHFQKEGIGQSLCCRKQMFPPARETGPLKSAPISRGRRKGHLAARTKCGCIFRITGLIALIFIFLRLSQLGYLEISLHRLKKQANPTQYRGKIRFVGPCIKYGRLHSVAPSGLLRNRRQNWPLPFTSVSAICYVIMWKG